MQCSQRHSNNTQNDNKQIKEGPHSCQCAAIGEQKKSSERKESMSGRELDRTPRRKGKKKMKTPKRENNTNEKWDCQSSAQRSLTWKRSHAQRKHAII